MMESESGEALILNFMEKCVLVLLYSIFQPFPMSSVKLEAPGIRTQ